MIPRLRFAGALLLAAAGLALAAAAAESDPGIERIADDVYVVGGDLAPPSPANRGRVANVGVIVGPSGSVVIGTGTSDADGEAILAAATRLGGRPVVLAINTYAAPEHVLGNGAFARHGIAILAHRATDEYMAANCERCQRNLELLAGAAALSGTRPQRAERLIEGSTSLVAGGRRLEIFHYGTTQQPGSIAVFDRESGVLFAGGLATFGVIPDAHDADLARWGEALRQLRQLPIRRVVPVRGAPAGPEKLLEVAGYLKDLAAATRSAYDRGLGLADATEKVTLPNYAGWAQYPEIHRRNVHFQYLRLEAESFAPLPVSAVPAGDQ